MVRPLHILTPASQVIDDYQSYCHIAVTANIAGLEISNGYSRDGCEAQADPVNVRLYG